MDRITVSVRFRPLNFRERNSNNSESWLIYDDGLSVVQTHVVDGNRMTLGSAFGFDHVFGPESSNSQVYEKSVSEIITSALNGVNGTIFAYGQTSSGKTFTMHGGENPSLNPGIIAMAMSQIFSTIKDTPDREYLLRVSYLEIYNEVIKDLLDPSKFNLKIHETVDRQIFVGNLTEDLVMSVEDVMNAISKGEANRHVGETNMNEHSSRSHTIFRMVIESREKSQQGNKENGRNSMSGGAVKVSTLNLVDLAGSERIGHTGSEGIRLKEGAHINKSLLALGTVIAKLSEGSESHIPYRDSKLTRILQPSLGGNARTAIICTATLASGFVEETQSTLKFANRAKCIRNNPEVNEVVSDEALLRRYRNEINNLKKKLEQNSDVVQESTHEHVKKQLEETKAEKLELMEKLSKLKTFILNAPNQAKKSKSIRRQTWFPGASIQEESSRPGSPHEAESPSKKCKIDDNSLFKDPVTRQLQMIQVERKELKQRVSLLEDEKRDSSITLKSTSMELQKLSQDSKTMARGFRNSLLEVLVISKELQDAVNRQKLEVAEKTDFMEIENQSLAQAFNDLSGEYDNKARSWEGEKESLLSENSSLKERVSELNNLISSEKEKSSLLKDDLEKNVNESREMWEKSYSMEYDLQKLEKKINGHLSNLNIECDKSSVSDKLGCLVDHLKNAVQNPDLKKEFDELVASNLANAAVLSKKDEELEDLRNQNSALTKDFHEEKEKAASQMVVFNQQVEELNGNLDEALEMIVQRDGEIALIRSEHSELKDSFQSLSESRETGMNSQVNSLLSVIKENEELLGKRDEEIKSLIDQVSNLGAELQREREVLEAANAKFIKELGDSESSRAAISEQLSLIEEELEKSFLDSTELRKKAVDAETSLADFKAKYDKLLEQSCDKSSSYDAARTQLSDIESKVTELNGFNADLQQKLNMANEENRALLMKLSQVLMASSENEEAMKSQLAEASKEMEKLKFDLDAEKKKFESNLISKESELGRIPELEMELKECKAAFEKERLELLEGIRVLKTDIQSKDEDLLGSQKEYDEISTELRNLRLELDANSKTLRSLNELKERLEIQVETQIHKIEVLNEDLLQSQKSEDQSAIILQLQSQCTKFRQEIQAIGSQKADLENLLDEKNELLRRNKEEMQNSMNSLSESLETKTRALAASEQRMEALKTEVSDLKNRSLQDLEIISEKDDQVHGLTEELEKLKDEMSLKQNQAKETFKNLKSSEMEWHRKCSEMEEKLLDIKVELAEACDTINELKGSEDFSKKVSELELDLSHSEQVNQSLKEELTSVQAKVKGLEHLPGKLSDLQKDLHDSEKRIHLSNEELASTLAKVQQYKNKSDELEDVVTKGKALVKNLDNELRLAKNRVYELEQHNEEVDQNLTAENEALKEELQTKVTEIEQLKHAFQGKKEKVEKYISALQADIEEKSASIESYANLLREKEEEVKSSQHIDVHYKNLYEQQLEVHEEERLKKEKENIKLTNQLSELRDQLEHEKQLRNRSVSDLRRKFDDKLTQLGSQLEDSEKEALHWKKMYSDSKQQLQMIESKNNDRADAKENKENESHERETLKELANASRRRIRQLQPQSAAMPGRQPSIDKSKSEQCNQQ